MALESCGAEVALLRKALTAGLLMNAVQLVDTTADVTDPSSSGINVYRILRSTGPGASTAHRGNLSRHATGSVVVPSAHSHLFAIATECSAPRMRLTSRCESFAPGKTVELGGCACTRNGRDTSGPLRVSVLLGVCGLCMHQEPYF